MSFGTVELSKWAPLEYFRANRSKLWTGSATTNVAVEYSHYNFVSLYPRQPCHGLMGRISLHGLTKVWTSLAISNVDKKEDYIDHSEAEKWWAFVLDTKDSPWKSQLREPNVVLGDKGEMIGVGLEVDTDTMSNVFINLLMALRLPIEHPGAIRVFNKAVAGGLSRKEALVLTMIGKMDRSGNYKYVDHVHFPFNRDGICWERVRDSNPFAGTERQRTSAYRFSSSVWNAHDLQKRAMNIDDFIQYQGESKYTGPFSLFLKNNYKLLGDGKYPMPNIDFEATLAYVLANRKAVFPPAIDEPVETKKARRKK